ncbi:MAG: S41 family peptidase [Planctomycetota bacterium]
MPKRNFIWLVIVLATAVVSVLVARIPQGPGSTHNPDFDPVAATYDLIRRNYYRPLDETAVRSASVRGMVEALDEFSSFVPAEQMDTFDHRVMGHQRGTGLRLRRRGDELITRWPVFGSPAHHAKITPGMVLLGIDQTDANEMTLELARHALRGPLGEDVLVTLRDAEGRTHFITLRRAEFELETVQGLHRISGARWETSLDPNSRLAYLRVTEFVRGTSEQLRTELWKLNAPAGLVLDLRGNPGGLLEEAVRTANFFLRDGAIVSISERRGPDRVHKARSHETWLDAPVVVLADASTASAAEIVVASLGYHARAIVLGERTRGKGCIQTMFPLPGGLGQINLTTGEFRVGDGLAISPAAPDEPGGYAPHVAISIDDAQLAKLAEVRNRAGALGPPPKKSTTQPTTQPEPAGERAAGRAALLEADPQLAEAAAILRDPDRLQVELAAVADRAEAAARMLAGQQADPDAVRQPAGEP